MSSIKVRNKDYTYHNLGRSRKRVLMGLNSTILNIFFEVVDNSDYIAKWVSYGVSNAPFATSKTSNHFPP